MVLPSGESIQVEEGKFARIHNDILNALALARFNGAEYRCLMFLFRKTYGWGKKEDAISVSQWASGVGMEQEKRHNVWRTIQGLIRKNVIYAIDNGNNRPKTYGFVKYWEQWDASLFPETVMQLDNSETQTVMQSDNRTVMQQDNKTVMQPDNYKRKKESLKKAASPSDNSVTTLEHSENDGTYTIELLRATGRFFHFPHDSRLRAMGIEDTYRSEDIQRGVNLVVKRNDENIQKGKKAIRDPVGYLAGILADEANPKPPPKQRKKIYYTDPATGEMREKVV